MFSGTMRRSVGSSQAAGGGEWVSSVILHMNMPPMQVVFTRLPGIWDSVVNVFVTTIATLC
jgi:hypothetical protein